MISSTTLTVSDRAGQVFLQSLTMKYYPTPTRAYGALMIFVFTWVSLVSSACVSSIARASSITSVASGGSSAVGLYAGISLVGVLIFGFVVAGHQAILTRIQVPSGRDRGGRRDA